MNISIEAKKAEAVRRLKALGYFEPSIRDFEKHGYVAVNEPPFGAHFYTVYGEYDKVEKAIKGVEERYDCLVYAVLHTFANFGELYEFLVVEDYEEDWEMFVADANGGYVFAWVENVDVPMYSEFGSVVVKRTPAGGLQRIL